MNELTTLPPPTLEIIDGVPTVLSTVVADYFGYRHDNLLQIIRGLIARNSELLCLLYFQETTTSRPHPKNPDVFIESPAFRMNQTGFNILAMKLSGKRAERYQIRFAQAFEAAVKALQNINNFLHYREEERDSLLNRFELLSGRNVELSFVLVCPEI